MRVLAYFLPGCLSLIAQNTAPSEGRELPSISIRGRVEIPPTFDLDDLSKLPQRKVIVRTQGVQAVEFSGPTLQTVLELVGLRFGDELLGNRLAAFVTAEASTGPRVVFSLPELDQSNNQRFVIVAISRNGKPLSGLEGPFCIVVQGDGKRELSVGVRDTS